MASVGTAVSRPATSTVKKQGIRCDLCKTISKDKQAYDFHIGTILHRTKAEALNQQQESKQSTDPVYNSLKIQGSTCSNESLSTKPKMIKANFAKKSTAKSMSILPASCAPTTPSDSITSIGELEQHHRSLNGVLNGQIKNMKNNCVAVPPGENDTVDHVGVNGKCSDHPMVSESDSGPCQDMMEKNTSNGVENVNIANAEDVHKEKSDSTNIDDGTQNELGEKSSQVKVVGSPVEINGENLTELKKLPKFVLIKDSMKGMLKAALNQINLSKVSSTGCSDDNNSDDSENSVNCLTPEPGVVSDDEYSSDTKGRPVTPSVGKGNLFENLSALSATIKSPDIRNIVDEASIKKNTTQDDENISDTINVSNTDTILNSGVKNDTEIVEDMDVHEDNDLESKWLLSQGMNDQTSEANDIDDNSLDPSEEKTEQTSLLETSQQKDSDVEMLCENTGNINKLQEDISINEKADTVLLCDYVSDQSSDPPEKETNMEEEMAVDVEKENIVDVEEEKAGDTPDVASVEPAAMTADVECGASEVMENDDSCANIGNANLVQDSPVEIIKKGNNMEELGKNSEVDETEEDYKIEEIEKENNVEEIETEKENKVEEFETDNSVEVIEKETDNSVEVIEKDNIETDNSVEVIEKDNTMEEIEKDSNVVIKDCDDTAEASDQNCPEPMDTHVENDKISNKEPQSVEKISNLDTEEGVDTDGNTCMVLDMRNVDEPSGAKLDNDTSNKCVEIIENMSSIADETSSAKLDKHTSNECVEIDENISSIAAETSGAELDKETSNKCQEVDENVSSIPEGTSKKKKVPTATLR